MSETLAEILETNLVQLEVQVAELKEDIASTADLWERARKQAVVDGVEDAIRALREDIRVLKEDV